MTEQDQVREIADILPESDAERMMLALGLARQARDLRDRALAITQLAESTGREPWRASSGSVIQVSFPDERQMAMSCERAQYSWGNLRSWELVWETKPSGGYVLTAERLGEVLGVSWLAAAGEEGATFNASSIEYNPQDGIVYAYHGSFNSDGSFVPFVRVACDVATGFEEQPHPLVNIDEAETLLQPEV